MDNKMTLGQWVLTIFLSGIPCVGLILLIIWAAGDGGGYTARKTFSQAFLIVMIAIYVLSFIMGMVSGMAGYMVGGSSASMIFF